MMRVKGMAKTLQLDEDRLLPPDPGVRAIARRLYAEVKDLPVISPHGHTDPAWFADDAPFADATSLLLAPDHYLYRMLYSQGVRLEELAVPAHGNPAAADPREAWRKFAGCFHLFHGTPSALWLNDVFANVLGLEVWLDAGTADLYYDTIQAALARPDFRPRALFTRFNIEVLATTESPTDSLQHHRVIRDSGWTGRVITAYRPDPSSIPSTRRSPRRSSASATCRARTSSAGTATWQRIASGASSSRAPERRPPIMATPRRARPTCPQRKPRPCSAAFWVAVAAPRTQSCSGRRC